MEQGHLRRRRVTLFVGYRIPAGTAKSDSLLELADAALSQWERTLSQVLGNKSAAVGNIDRPAREGLFGTI